MKQLFQIIGSVEIFGNPIQLYNNVGEGIMDFFDKPIEGFIQGPLEGGKGLIKGTASLVGKTVVGVTNTLSKITGSMA
jgi:vacuolar protein sorting-associated protein 13A/C